MDYSTIFSLRPLSDVATEIVKSPLLKALIS